MVVKKVTPSRMWQVIGKGEIESAQLVEFPRNGSISVGDIWLNDGTNSCYGSHGFYWAKFVSVAETTWTCGPWYSEEEASL